MSDLNKLVNKWRAEGGAMEQAADELERALSAQGKAVAGCYVDDNLGVVLCKRGHEKGRRLYTHPAPRVEVDEAMVERACEGYLLEAKRQNFNPSEAWARSQQARDWMRAALTSALNPEAGNG